MVGESVEDLITSSEVRDSVERLVEEGGREDSGVLVLLLSSWTAIEDVWDVATGVILSVTVAPVGGLADMLEIVLATEEVDPIKRSVGAKES